VDAALLDTAAAAQGKPAAGVIDMHDELRDGALPFIRTRPLLSHNPPDSHSGSGSGDHLISGCHDRPNRWGHPGFKGDDLPPERH
jgi:hypothetical protein